VTELSLLAVLFGGLAGTHTCDLKECKPVDAMKAETAAGTLQVTWQGERDQQLRAQFAIRDGQPLVQELAASKGQGSWIVLARNVTPEFEVTSDVRRMSEQQADPRRAWATHWTNVRHVQTDGARLKVTADSAVRIEASIQRKPNCPDSPPIYP
jgi:hypothetical protein